MTTLATLQVRAGSKLGLGSYLLRDETSATKIFFGVLVVDEKFAVLTIAVGLVASDGDSIEYAVGLVEDRVHLFKRAVGSFRIEEVDNREDEGVAFVEC